MQDRDIFTDVLAGTKHSISCYTNAITETSNQQLRSTWQTLRGEAEQMQYQIYKMAEQKGYYTPAPQANQQDLQSIKSSLTSAVNNMNTSGTSSNIFSGATSGTGMGQGSQSMAGMTSSSKQNMTSSSQQLFTNSTNKQTKNKK
ncbi:MAG: spore coat protein [Tissierellia bacterium]|jgi:hypothetical protein|nr:spore coat protein [Tissierellia bacterium]